MTFMLSERLRALRTYHKWTQEDLAKQLNVAVSTVSGYENGSRRPDIDTLIRLSELFQVSVDYLIGRSEQPSIEPRSIDLSNLDSMQNMRFELDNQPLSTEDKQYMLAIIREKRKLNRQHSLD
jgi:transcriptional regulator with XRE-family HTH domain